MINTIKRHIAAFGSKFVVAEFLCVVLGTLAVTIFFASAGRLVLAIIGLGITLNCLPILVVGVRRLGHEPETKTIQGRDKGTDKQTLNDTLVLSGALIIPFVLVGIAIYEVYDSNKAYR